MIAYPNPFEKDFIIDYELEEPEKVSIILTNPLGMVVDVLENAQSKESGRHFIRYNGAKLHSGTYYVTLRAGSQVETMKVAAVR